MIASVGHEPAMLKSGSSRACSSPSRRGVPQAVCARAYSRSMLGSSRLEHGQVIPYRSHVIRLALFTFIQLQLPRSLTFPLPIPRNTYYSRDLKGSSKSARACKSSLAARAHSSILKYLGGSSLRTQGCLEPARFQH